MKSAPTFSDTNILRVLRLIWQKKGISRSGLAGELGIDKSTVTKIIADLQKSGIVREYAVGKPGPLGGRKPVSLEINPSFACVGGIEINPERIICCLLDLHGSILFRHDQPFISGSDPIEESFKSAFSVLDSRVRSSSLNLAGIGVGMPGIINADNGTVRFSIPLGIHSPRDFSRAMYEKYKVPVYIENDALCCCYCERTLVFDQGVKNALFVLVEFRETVSGKKNEEETFGGTLMRQTERAVFEKNGNPPREISFCIGMGFVLNGKIYRGYEHSAGEFRSILCSGGESQFSSPQMCGRVFGPDGIGERIPVFGELAAHIAFLINTLNLEKVFIGGIPDNYALELSAMVRSAMTRQWPYENELPVRCEIVSSTLGNLSVAFGAAGMCIDRFFSPHKPEKGSCGSFTALDAIRLKM